MVPSLPPGWIALPPKYGAADGALGVLLSGGPQAGARERRAPSWLFPLILGAGFLAAAGAIGAVFLSQQTGSASRKLF